MGRLNEFSLSGQLAQSVECLVYTERVSGSSPLLPRDADVPINFKWNDQLRFIKKEGTRSVVARQVPASAHKIAMNMEKRNDRQKPNKRNGTPLFNSTSVLPALHCIIGFSEAKHSTVPRKRTFRTRQRRRKKPGEGDLDEGKR